jgi:membrane protein
MAGVTGTRQDWKHVARHVYRDVREKNLPSHAQLIAYNLLFSIAPLLIFVTAFCGFVVQQVNDNAANPVEPVLDWLRGSVPRATVEFLEQPLTQALNTSPGFLISIGGILALWSAKGAIGAITNGLNAAYGVKDSRSWLVRTATAMGLTIALALAVIVSSGVFFLGTGVGQTAADAIGLGTAFATVSTWLRWPLIAVLVVAAITLLHQYAPDVSAPFRWYLPGATLTLVLTVIASLALGIYFQLSTGFEAYGVFGGVLAFIFFLYVLGLVILIGGVFNAAVQEELPGARRDIGEHREDTAVASGDGHPVATGAMPYRPPSNAAPLGVRIATAVTAVTAAAVLVVRRILRR